MWYALSIGALAACAASAVVLQQARRRGWGRVRLAAAVAFGAALGVLAFAALTRLPAELDWLYAYNYPTLSEDPGAQHDAALMAHKGAVVDELWARAMLPPAARQPCYAPDPAVCALADLVSARAAGYGLDRGEGFYGLRAWLGVGLGLIGGAVAWWAARSRQQGAPSENAADRAGG